MTAAMPEEQEGRVGSADQRADDDQEAGQATQQQRRPDRGGEVGAAGRGQSGCLLGALLVGQFCRPSSRLPKAWARGRSSEERNMRRGTLLTQVLSVNLLLIAAAVLAALIASDPDNPLRDSAHGRPGARVRRRGDRCGQRLPARAPLRAARAARRGDGAGGPEPAQPRRRGAARQRVRGGAATQPRRSARCSSGSRPSAARARAPRSRLRSGSARGSRSTSTTRSTRL